MLRLTTGFSPHETHLCIICARRTCVCFAKGTQHDEMRNKKFANPSPMFFMLGEQPVQILLSYARNTASSAPTHPAFSAHLKHGNLSRRWCRDFLHLFLLNQVKEEPERFSTYFDLFIEKIFKCISHVLIRGNHVSLLMLHHDRILKQIRKPERACGLNDVVRFAYNV